MRKTWIQDVSVHERGVVTLVLELNARNKRDYTPKGPKYMLDESKHSDNPLLLASIFETQLQLWSGRNPLV